MSNDFVRLPLLNDYVDHWAAQRPDETVIIAHETGRTVTYAQFKELSDSLALQLLSMGVQPGDRVATMLLLSPEHMALMYACSRIGAICAPLDVRLQDGEVARDLGKIDPCAFFVLGKTPLRDFTTAARAALEACPSIRHLIQCPLGFGDDEIMAEAISLDDLLKQDVLIRLVEENRQSGALERAYKAVTPLTPTLIIFTTGTTGQPKPALLTHECIIVQNEVLARGGNCSVSGKNRILINLPPSHVGCVTECFMTIVAVGGCAVCLMIFDPKASLDAIQAHKVNFLGMIPTQFRMIWAVPGYESYDLSSLERVAYAGAAGDLPFLQKLSQMAPEFYTGIGMTENAGFATMTPRGISPEEMVGQVGRAFPDLAEVSIRKPMLDDGRAGDEMPDGEMGEICYHPPIVFAGYYNMPEETAKAVSQEGILYTGDLGFFQDKGSYRALCLAGRKKFIVKQKGYNVFPDEVEDHISRMDKVAVAQVLGAPHAIFDEGILAFVQPKPGMDLTGEEVLEHCKKIASFKRPQHVVIWPADEALPLTRTAKVDKMALKANAMEVIAELRAQGGWDKA
ncbi:MAG: acyl--CoA ligase [Desulfatibacillum sp.]|nr:acyl--CoA ligase [Desulfatibacillum sp.]